MEQTLADMRRELEELKALLFLRNPFLAVLLGAMRIGVHSGVRTVAATRQGETLVNPDYWRQLAGPAAKTFILLHEALHLAFQHPWSARGRDQGLFNVAADMVVNEMLFRHGHREAPGNPVTAPAVREMLRARQVIVTTEALRRASSDEVYLLLTAAARNQPVQAELQDVPMDLNPSEEPPADPGDNIIQEGYRGPGDDPAERWRVVVARAAAIADQAGTSPGELQRVLTGFPKPRVDWRLQLREILHDRTGRTVATTWEQPSRRYAAFPGVKRLGVQTIRVLVDCSGSITEQALNQFVAEIWGLARVFRCELRVYPWDAKAYPPFRVTAVGQLRLRAAVGLKGGGGTMLGPVLGELERRFRPLDVVTIISDGHIADLENRETMRRYRRLSRQASAIVFLTTGRRPDLPRTRFILLELPPRR